LKKRVNKSIFINKKLIYFNYDDNKLIKKIKMQVCTKITKNNNHLKITLVKNIIDNNYVKLVEFEIGINTITLLDIEQILSALKNDIIYNNTFIFDDLIPFTITINKKKYEYCINNKKINIYLTESSFHKMINALKNNLLTI
jgi:hypothetical protein